MRSPFDTDAEENAVATGFTAGVPVSRDPSYPDRARLDSDVRAFLRPASTPWIVFDRDSRIDALARSAHRIGAIFASRPTLPDRAPSKPMFPDDPTTSAAPVAEPSSVTVATDVVPPPPSVRPRSRFTIPDGLVRRRPHALGIGAVTVGVVLGIAALVAVHPTKHALDASPPAPAVAGLAPATPAPVAPAPAVPPSPAPIAPPPAAVAVAAQAAGTAEEPATPRAQTSDADARTKRLGKLTIKGDAKTKTVWFDGKRMLGTGTRTFLVACGMHTVAVNEKIDARDIEVPCNGEYVAAGR